jgi:hypothetical protein
MNTAPDEFSQNSEGMKAEGSSGGIYDASQGPLTGVLAFQKLYCRACFAVPCAAKHARQYDF